MLSKSPRLSRKRQTRLEETSTTVSRLEEIRMQRIVEILIELYFFPILPPGERRLIVAVGLN